MGWRRLGILRVSSGLGLGILARTNGWELLVMGFSLMRESFPCKWACERNTFDSCWGEFISLQGHLFQGRCLCLCSCCWYFCSWFWIVCLDRWDMSDTSLTMSTFHRDLSFMNLEGEISSLFAELSSLETLWVKLTKLNEPHAASPASSVSKSTSRDSWAPSFHSRGMPRYETYESNVIVQTVVWRNWKTMACVWHSLLLFSISSFQTIVRQQVQRRIAPCSREIECASPLVSHTGLHRCILQ